MLFLRSVGKTKKQYKMCLFTHSQCCVSCSFLSKNDICLMPQRVDMFHVLSYCQLANKTLYCVFIIMTCPVQKSINPFYSFSLLRCRHSMNCSTLSGQKLTSSVSSPRPKSSISLRCDDDIMYMLQQRLSELQSYFTVIVFHSESY